MTEARAWSYIVVAGLLEVVWAIALKYSDGFTKWAPSVVTILGMAGSMWLLSQAIRVLPAGTSYAVWVGIGAVGTAILGMALLGESRNPLRLVCIGVIVTGIMGLRASK